MNKPVLLVLGAGVYQLDAISEGRRLGFSVVALDGSASAPGLPLADQGLVVDIKDVDACLAVARELRPAGVITVASELAVTTQAAICDALHLPGPTADAAYAATHKNRMRDLFLEQGVACARYRNAMNVDEAIAAAVVLGYPAVVKPCDSSGSRGVMRVETVAAMAGAFAHAKNFSASGTVMIEEFMEGDEIAVEAFVCRGNFHALALSRKKRSAYPYLLDLQVDFPACLEPGLEKQVLSLAAHAVHALGIDMAPIHMEIMLTPQGPKVVEVAARGAGFHVFTRMVPWVTGINVIEQNIIMATGGMPDFVLREQRAAILHFPSAAPGNVVAVHGLDYARAIPEVVDAEIFVKPGDRVEPLTAGIDRIGYVIILAQDGARADRVLGDVVRELRVETVQ